MTEESLTIFSLLAVQSQIKSLKLSFFEPILLNIFLDDFLYVLSFHNFRLSQHFDFNSIKRQVKRSEFTFLDFILKLLVLLLEVLDNYSD